MSGFIATPTMGDIEQLQQHILALQKRVAALESAGKEVAVPTPRTRGHRLPESWTPRPETIEKMCAELMVPRQSLYQEHNKFKDHFLSAPGQKGVKVDWDRAWCNWMRNASEHGSLRGGRSAPRRTNDDKIRELMEMDIAQGE